MLRVSLIGLLLGACVAASGENAQRDPTRADADSGRQLYLEHCASCHGLTGKGDGIAAATLRRPLPDLSLLARKSGGTYPSEEVARTIDGRKRLAGHRRDGMPLWGNVFSRLEADEKNVRTGIEALVAYVKSLQQ